MYRFKSYQKAKSVSDAIRHLQMNPQARLIAGGTDVLIKLHKGNDGFQHLVDIHDIQALKKISISKRGSLNIGSGINFTTLAESSLILENIPMLAEAACTVGGPQIRNMATIGGNICNGVPSADSAPPLFVYNAILTLEGADRKRRIPIDAFYTGPGKVDIRPHEVLTAITIQQHQYKRFHGRYVKYAMREAMDIATIGCAALCNVEKGVIKDLRVAFGVAGPVPLRCKNAEAFAKGKKISKQLVRDIAMIIPNDLNPRSSWRATKEFRMQIIKTLAERVIESALAGAQEKSNE